MKKAYSTAKAKAKVVKEQVHEAFIKHHLHLVWTAVTLLAISAVAFAVEMLAIGGALGVLGVLLQGLSDTE